jgi:8-oxo-dGTP diphosphatase
MARIEVAVGGVAMRGDEVLLIRRANEPGAGQWSVPGGRVEFGEDLREALVREFLEETGLEVVVHGFLGWVERIDADADPPYHFVILDFMVDPFDATAPLRPADDVSDAKWVSVLDLESIDLVDGLLEFLDDAGVCRSAPIVPFVI